VAVEEADHYRYVTLMDKITNSWIDVFPTREVQLRGFLGDIESHLPNNHPYKSNDKITWAHEGTHGINARIRNSLGSSYNAMYVFQNLAFVAKEPNFKLADVAKTVPTELIGDGYQLYLVNQQRYWNNQPLYVFDELSAYVNGTSVGIELNVEYNRVEHSFSKVLEFLGYSFVLLQLAENAIVLSNMTAHADSFIQEHINNFPDLIPQYQKVDKYAPLWF
jgi:hypothetical protein